MRAPFDLPPVPHLLMLQAESSLCAGRRWLRARGIRVLAEHGPTAFEILASSDQAELVLRKGPFVRCARGPVPSSASGSPLAISQRWNVRFEERYANQHRLHRERECTRPTPPVPPEPVAELWTRLRKLLDRASRIPTPSLFAPRHSLLAPEGLVGEAVPSRSCLIQVPRPTAPIPVLEGRVGISVVFAEPTGAVEARFPEAELPFAIREIIDGLSWLAQEHPTGDLTFSYRFRSVRPRIDEAPNDPNERFSAVQVQALRTLLGHPPTQKPRDLIAMYLASQFGGRETTKAIIVLVVPIEIGRPEQVTVGIHGSIRIASWGQWHGHGRASLDGIVAHEVLHAFGALDEYDGAHRNCDAALALNGGAPVVLRTPDYGAPAQDERTPHPLILIPNNNHVSVARPHQPCVMGYYPRRLCAYTRAQIGWTDLLVELETAPGRFAGTDSTVTLDIGDEELPLDTLEHDDRWPGHRAAYYNRTPVERCEVKRLMLRKAAGGSWHAWNIRRMRVWFRRKALLYDTSSRLASEEPIWLDDRDTSWLARGYPTTDPDLIDTVAVVLESSSPPTGDGLEVSLGGRRWVVLSPPGVGGAPWAYRARLDAGPGLYAGALSQVAVRRLGSGSSPPWTIEALWLEINGDRRFDLEGFRPCVLPTTWREYPLSERHGRATG